MRRKSEGISEPETLARVRHALERLDALDSWSDVRMAASPWETGEGASPLFEVEPMADDILPDQIRRFADVPEEDEDGLTARPRSVIHAFPPEELPAG